MPPFFKTSKTLRASCCGLIVMGVDMVSARPQQVGLSRRIEARVKKTGNPCERVKFKPAQRKQSEKERTTSDRHVQTVHLMLASSNGQFSFRVAGTQNLLSRRDQASHKMPDMLREELVAVKVTVFHCVSAWRNFFTSDVRLQQFPGVEFCFM